MAERIVGDMVLQGIPRKAPAKLLLVSLFAVVGFAGIGALCMAIVEPRDASLYVPLGLLLLVMMPILWYINTRTKVKIPILSKKGLIYVQEGDDDGETILRWRDVSNYEFINFGSSSQTGRHLSLCAPNRLPLKRIKFAHCTDAFKNFSYSNHWEFNRLLLIQIGFHGSEKLLIDPIVFEQLQINPDDWSFMPKPLWIRNVTMWVGVVVYMILSYVLLDGIGPGQVYAWLSFSCIMFMAILLIVALISNKLSRFDGSRCIRFIKESRVPS